jgi:DNA-binding LacI/PurR family transcriptional regulator
LVSWGDATVAKLKDVARYAGVSISTASRVLNDYPHVTEPVRRRVLDAASVLGYRANVVARSMRLGRSHSLGLIVRDMRSGNFGEICAAAEAVAEANGYDLFVCNSNRNPHKERRYLESLLERQVDAVMLFVADDRINNLDVVHREGTAIVLVSSGLSDDRSDRVDTGDAEAAVVATGHLIALGHSRIAFLAWDQQIPSGHERLGGFKAAMARAGLEVDPAWVRYCGVDAARAASEVQFVLDLDTPPTALIAAATDLVPGALVALRDRQLRAPRDISVVAFDDREAARLFDPPLTVMRRNVGDVGRVATELALQRITDPAAPPRKLEIPFSLVVRGSTGPRTRSAAQSEADRRGDPA